MGTNHRIINGDSRDMSLLEDKSVELIVTSPPYWQLKDYADKNQIGFHEDYESYINNLNLVWAECFRVLKSGCRMAINIGDQFARAVYYGRYKVIPIRTEIIRFCETIGFDYMGAVIWQKVTTTNTTGGATIMGSFPYPRNGILKIDYEFILFFKKLGKGPTPSKIQKEESKITIEDWNTYFSGHWNFPGVRQNGHLAMYPEELPARIIKMFSFVNETVLDPFLGSGTTSLAAVNNKRNSIGFEINESFIPVIKQKLNSDQANINCDVFVYEKHITSRNFEESIKELPYRYSDPKQFDKKFDTRKLTFGSRISNDSPRDSQNNLYKVEYVLNSTSVLLDNGLIISLAGLREIDNKKQQAHEFLEGLLKSQKVSFKPSQHQSGKRDTIEGFLYLKNKLFVNAHLLKKGFVGIDESRIEFREFYKKYL